MEMETESKKEEEEINERKIRTRAISPISIVQPPDMGNWPYVWRDHVKAKVLRNRRGLCRRKSARGRIESKLFGTQLLFFPAGRSPRANYPIDRARNGAIQSREFDEVIPVSKVEWVFETLYFANGVTSLAGWDYWVVKLGTCWVIDCVTSWNLDLGVRC